MGDMLSQDEINALLGVVNGIGSENPDSGKADAAETLSAAEDYDNLLTDEEKDVLGEMGNIAMGTSATTLFTILRNRVSITTPRVNVMTWRQITENYLRPCVGIKISYKIGFVGSNILILQDHDVKIITNLMMGGDGIVPENEPINDIDLSAIGEAMNQMVGSSVTSLASLVDMKIDIETPKAFIFNNDDDEINDMLDTKPDEKYVRISFKMEIGDLIDSEIMQVFPLDFAKEIVKLMKNEKSEIKEEKIEEKKNDTKKEVKKEAPPPPQKETTAHRPPPEPKSFAQNVNVSPVQFQNFDINELNQQKENIDIIMDVPLEVTVELGRTRKRIKDILEFSPGTIVELDKIAGEPIDVLVNGRFVAKGEVVVIDENFGIRIVDIISSENRI